MVFHKTDIDLSFSTKSNVDYINSVDIFNDNQKNNDYCYSDDEFMDKVHKNGDKIHGVPPSAVISAGKTIDPNKQ